MFYALMQAFLFSKVQQDAGTGWCTWLWKQPGIKGHPQRQLGMDEVLIY